MKICVRCIIAGRVQGVFFRASTREQAVRLGISGYARNQSDGTVEVLACGEQRSIDELKGWLAKGPVHARVSTVTCESVPQQEPIGFSTK